MKKVLISLLSIGAVAVVAVFATQAFFSDTETSTGNTFTAGSIDLKVDARVNVSPNNLNLVQFGPQDLNGGIIFTYTDLKPGDTGDGYFSIHGTSNDYWACMRTTDVSYGENGIVDPEVEAGDNTTPAGELQNYLDFAFWNDLNNNGQYDSGTDANLVGPWLEGSPGIPAGLYSMPGLVAAGWIPLADSTGVLGPSFFSGSPLSPSNTYYLGYKYCFGVLAPDLSCNGSGNQNDAQTDNITGSLKFYAIQSRNNLEFTCQGLTQ